MSQNKELILGWDVGVVHLAFCLLEKNGEKFDIVDWQNINVMENEVLKCNSMTKKGICGKKASFQFGDNCYCGTHKGKHVVEKINIELVDNGKCGYVSASRGGNDGKVCGARAKCMINDTLSCNAHKKMIEKKILEKSSLVSIKKVTSKNTDSNTICKLIYSKLDAIKSIQNVNQVYIENQPAYVNASMKGVASYIFAYFARQSMTNNCSVKYISASAKTSFNKETIEHAYKLIEEHKKIKSIDCKCNKCVLEEELNRCVKEHGTNYKLYKAKTKEKNYKITKELGYVCTHLILTNNNLLHKLKLIEGKVVYDPCDAFLHAHKKL